MKKLLLIPALALIFILSFCDKITDPIVKTTVDYEWELNAGGQGQYRLHPHVALVGGGFVRRLTVDGTQGRGTQTGGRVDGGIRIDGTRGAVEFFLAVERRIDPYPLQFNTERWTSVGMRFVNR